MKISVEHALCGILRLSMGFIFFWAFIDKVFGLGFSTEAGKGWIDGMSPTFGYLTFATHGPFTPIFQALAGLAVVDWLFMSGLFLIGLSLILGIGVRVAGYSASLMLFLMFLAASLPPEHNPLIDEHIIYILILLIMVRLPVGKWFGLGEWWSKRSMVKDKPYLL